MMRRPKEKAAAPRGTLGAAEVTDTREGNVGSEKIASATSPTEVVGAGWRWADALAGAGKVGNLICGRAVMGLRLRIKIGPKPMARNSSDPLHIEHALSWNLPPL